MVGTEPSPVYSKTAHPGSSSPSLPLRGQHTGLVSTEAHIASLPVVPAQRSWGKWKVWEACVLISFHITTIIIESDPGNAHPCSLDVHVDKR